MKATFDIPDEDQGRVYTVTVLYDCRPEIGGPREYCVDVDRVCLDSCTVRLAGYPCEVRLAGNLVNWRRAVEREFSQEIIEKCVEHYEAMQNREDVA